MISIRQLPYQSSSRAHLAQIKINMHACMMPRLGLFWVVEKWPQLTHAEHPSAKANSTKSLTPLNRVPHTISTTEECLRNEICVPFGWIVAAVGYPGYFAPA